MTARRRRQHDGPLEAKAGAPKTVGEAVDRLMLLPVSMLRGFASLPRHGVQLLHRLLGLYIRNEYGLWADVLPLRDDCAAKDTGAKRWRGHPDRCSTLIMEALWDRLHADPAPPLPVGGKKDMYRRLRRGEFGNTLRTWRSSAEIPTDYEGEVSVRISVGTGGHFVTGIDMRSVVRACRELQEAGVREADMVWCEPFPDGDLVLQGEVMELAPHGLVLHWSDVEGLNMREAAAKGWRTGVGLAAREILRARLTPASYDDLMELLDAYPGHVVEFSAARGCVGPCRGRNMVTWEVRSY